VVVAGTVVLLVVVVPVVVVVAPGTVVVDVLVVVGTVVVVLVLVEVVSAEAEPVRPPLKPEVPTSTAGSKPMEIAAVRRRMFIHPYLPGQKPMSNL
jgi:hypothetical protein